MEHYFTNNESLKSELRYINYKYEEYSFQFASDNGVFAKDKIDYGSRVLVETILKEAEKPISILDVGCGYGFMGIVLSKVFDSPVTLIDVNKRAVHLAQMNIKSNQVKGNSLVSDIYQEMGKEEFDLIVTNPPIRAGKKVVLDILKNAREYLSSKGSLWFVIRKDQGAKSVIKEIENIYRVDIRKKDKGFYIMRAEIS